MYGQLGVLFETYPLHSPTDRFPGMQPWLNQHKTVIERAPGWQVGEEHATDDRLGILAEALGEDRETSHESQRQMGQRIISAYQAPVEFASYDSTSFNAFHPPQNGEKGLLGFHHSRNYRPDILQFKQGLVGSGWGVEISALSLTGFWAFDFSVLCPPELALRNFFAGSKTGERLWAILALFTRPTISFRSDGWSVAAM